MSRPTTPRRPSDPRAAAEALFKPSASKAPLPTPAPSEMPQPKELVSLRLDREVLAYFQAEGAGWQDRINAALRQLVAPK